MAFVIAVEGSRAVGKTTLLRALSEVFPRAFVREGFEKSSVHFDMNSEEGFCACEKWYIEREIETFAKLPEGLVLLARGPESIEFHCLNYARLSGKTWDASQRLAHDIVCLRQCRSNRVLYLSASIDILKDRARADSKRRDGLEEWFEVWHPAMELFFLSLPHVNVLRTDGCCADDVLRIVTNWIQNECRGLLDQGAVFR